MPVASLLLPLQFGVPGAVELLVILLIALILFGLPLVLLGLLVVYVRRTNRKIDQLESRLEEAEAQDETRE